jgi:5-(carboxyamino)imidazole ribonucleotide mutase
MKQAAEALEIANIGYDMAILSAHRTPKEVIAFVESARERGLRVIIAGAGGAAHLPGVVAAYTELPVIGVPIAHGPLQGGDALLSIVQMPRGVPVATVAIGNAWNAGILALQILGAGGNEALLDKVRNYKDELRDSVLKKQLPKSD